MESLLFFAPVFILFLGCSLVLVRAGMRLSDPRRWKIVGLTAVLYFLSAFIVAGLLYSTEDLEGESALSIIQGVAMLGLSGAGIFSFLLPFLFIYALLIEKWTRQRLEMTGSA